MTDHNMPCRVNTQRLPLSVNLRVSSMDYQASEMSQFGICMLKTLTTPEPANPITVALRPIVQ